MSADPDELSRLVAVRDGGAQSLAARRPTAGAGHVGRGPGLVDKHQAVGVEIELPLEPFPAPRQDVGALLLGRMRRLFFSVIRRRAKNRQSEAVLTGTPACASSVPNSLNVMSGVRSSRPRISGACPSIRPERRSPPRGPGATEPTCRCRAHQRIALDAPTPNRSAAARHEAPAAIAATTRSRRSTDNAFDMPVGPPPDRKLESDPLRVGEAL